MNTRQMIFVACNADYATRFGRMNVTVERLQQMYDKLPENEK